MAKNNVFEWDTTAANNTDLGGGTFPAENCAPSAVNDGVREMMAQLRREVANQGTAIASAATTNIAASGTSSYVHITGTTTITSFGTANAGIKRWVVFDGALTLTYNATSLMLPGNANITTAAGDAALFVSEGSGNWRCLTYVKDDGGPTVNPNLGKKKIWVPVELMQAQTVNGPAAANVTATDVQYRAFDFDQTTPEYAHFIISMPSSWNEGFLTFIPVWTAASGSGDVLWRLAAVARSNDDAIAYTYTGVVTSTDTLLAAGDLHRGPESGGLTVEQSPAANDTVFFRIERLASDGADTLSADARLLGIELYFTTDAPTDSA